MRKGFTIPELVLVLGIIAVLAAILFPVFARCREIARSTSCKANLLNIFVALRIYAADFEGQFPADPPGLDALVSLGLVQRLTLQCPSAPYRGRPREEGEPMEPSYVYVGGLEYPARDHKMVVADARPRHSQTANALYSDGVIRMLPVPLWLEAIPRPVGEKAGIFGRTRGGGG